MNFLRLSLILLVSQVGGAFAAPHGPSTPNRRTSAPIPSVGQRTDFRTIEEASEETSFAQLGNRSALLFLRADLKVPATGGTWLTFDNRENPLHGKQRQAIACHFLPEETQLNRKACVIPEGTQIRVYPSAGAKNELNIKFASGDCADGPWINAKLECHGFQSGAERLSTNRLHAEPDASLTSKQLRPFFTALVSRDIAADFLDNDKDGIPDYLDRCPNTPKSSSPVYAQGRFIGCAERNDRLATVNSKARNPILEFGSLNRNETENIFDKEIAEDRASEARDHTIHQRIRDLPGHEETSKPLPLPHPEPKRPQPDCDQKHPARPNWPAHPEPSW